MNTVHTRLVWIVHVGVMVGLMLGLGSEVGQELQWGVSRQADEHSAGRNEEGDC